MNYNMIAITVRSATIELDNDTLFNSENPYTVSVNGQIYASGVNKNVFSIFELEPSTDYIVGIRDEVTGKEIQNSFTTLEESVRLNVKKFGAKGDGVHLDSMAIQAAILACPPKGTVYIPEGEYLCAPLFMKSYVTIELADGAVLKGHTDRAMYAMLPGYTMTTDEKDEYYLGTWEGNPLDAYASLITAIGVTDVSIIGKGTIDGNAQNADWWIDPKVRKEAWRPRTIFFNQCDKMLVQGVTIQNSPSWTIHPYLSTNLDYIDLKVQNDKHSPNTDGLDPESCSDVNIIGVRFSVGDDCIAIKSGKLYMGKKLKKPSERLTIRNCRMRHGHGAVVIGSEMSGGAKDIHVSKCLFENTDRGLRIKTRRGRGEDAIIDGITFDQIAMKEVLTPFVVNMFYFCDPDGKTEYVYSKETLPVDEWTPYLGKFTFTNITCDDSEWAAAYFYGLPEQPIEALIMKNVVVRFKEDASEGRPAMMSYVDDVSKMGIYANNVKKIHLENVVMVGYQGERLIAEGTEEVIDL